MLYVLLQVLSVSPELQKSGEVTKVTSYTSDLIELVSGVCPVSLQPPSALSTSSSVRLQLVLRPCKVSAQLLAGCQPSCVHMSTLSQERLPNPAFCYDLMLLCTCMLTF